MIDKAKLLTEIKADPSLAGRLDLGLSDVIDEREITVKLRCPEEEQFRGRPWDHVYLRRESDLGKPEVYGAHAWYRIVNGIAGGYLSDRRALNAFLMGGEQLTLELCA